MVYCLKCKKDREDVNSKLLKTKIGKTILSKWATCGRKNSRFMKEQESKEILSNLGLKTPLSKIPLFGYVFFYLDLI